MHPSGQISRHMLQAIQLVFRNFGLVPVRHVPVLFFRLEPGFDVKCFIIFNEHLLCENL